MLDWLKNIHPPPALVTELNYDLKDATRKKGKVAVGLSGGVDSAVTAALLLEAGYEVTGVFLKVWEMPGTPCLWPEDKRSAEAVASVLGIPLVFMDLSEVYKQKVINRLVDEYNKGRVPNPDIWCNQEVKFGAFWETAIDKGFDYVATGHYAGTETTSDNQFKLLSGVDNGKDQSYFLWTLNQEKLGKIILPLGLMTKTEVRTKAKALKLPNASRPDSQGLCFVGPVKMSEFLQLFIKTNQGPVLDTSNQVIGRHLGAQLYTPGQRHGLEIKSKNNLTPAYYVIDKNVKENTVTVAPINEAQIQSQVNQVVIEDINWIRNQPSLDKVYQARFRHLGEKVECSLESISDSSWKVYFQEPQSFLAPGQSLVIYEDRECLGGGIIK